MSIEVWVTSSDGNDIIEKTISVVETPAEAISLAERYRTQYPQGIVRLMADATTSDEDLTSLTKIAQLLGFHLEPTLL